MPSERTANKPAHASGSAHLCPICETEAHDRRASTPACIEWHGHRNYAGYGIKWIGEKRYRAHRLAWVEAYGQIPNDLCVLHRCDNRACINPDHLFLGTRGDNAKDRDAKKRWHPRFGEDNGFNKLTEKQARLIKYSSTASKILAARFGVHKETINAIRRGLTWKKV